MYESAAPLVVRETQWCSRVCPLCLGTGPLTDLGTRVIDNPTRRGSFRFELHDVVCSGCGFAMAEKVPPEDFLVDFYEAGFLRVKPDGVIPFNFDMGFRIDALSRHAAPGARVFEIGAGDGASVEAIRVAGFSASGIDPVKSEAGSSVTQVALGAANADAATGADAVVNYYVLEHVTDPRQFLTSCKNWLGDGGLLALEVPDFERSPEDALHPEHLSYFTRRTLRALVEACGFEVVEHYSPASRPFGQSLVARLCDRGASRAVAALHESAAADVIAQARVLFADALRRMEQRRVQIERLIARILGNHGPSVDIIVWGANAMATELGHACSRAGILDAKIVDRSPSKLGHRHDGFRHPITEPNLIPVGSHRHRAFLIASIGEVWHEQIKSEIEASWPGVSIYSARQLE